MTARIVPTAVSHSAQEEAVSSVGMARLSLLPEPDRIGEREPSDPSWGELCAGEGIALTWPPIVLPA